MRGNRIGLLTGLFIALLAGGAWLAPGTAQALSIDPNPLHEARDPGAPGGSLSADLYAISVENNRAVFQVSVSAGTLTGIDISMLFDEITAPAAFNFVSGAGFLGGAGVGGTAAVVPGGSEAQFDFAGGISAGQLSQQFFVDFVTPIQVGWDGGADFDNGYATTLQYSTSETPEPAALVLLGLALGSFALVRRSLR